MASPGPGKKLCGAVLPNRLDGRTCKNIAGKGTDHKGSGRCSRHGGSTRTHKAAAEKAAKAKAIDEARRACSLLGLDVPVEGDPAVVVLLEVERAQRAVEHWATELAMLAAAGASIDKDTPALALWMIERKTVADVAAKAQALGIMRRRVEIDEDTARQLMGVMMHFARLAGLDPDAPAVRSAGRVAMLALLPGGQAAA